MAVELSGCLRVGGGDDLQSYLADDLFNVFDLQSAAAINNTPIMIEADDGGFDSNLTGTTIQDVSDLIAELCLDMLGCGRTDVSERICAWRRQGEIDRFQQGVGEWMIRATDANGRKTCRDKVRYDLFLLQEQRKRSGPESHGQCLSLVRDARHIMACIFQGGHVYNERIELRSVFGFEYFDHRVRIERIGGQPIYGFRWYRYKFTLFEEILCFIYIFTDLGHEVTKVKVMMRILLCMALGLGIFLNASGQAEDRKLTRKLLALADDFRGDAGIYVQHLRTGRIAAINADSLFPTASMIKIPITIGMFSKIEGHELDYDSILTYRDSLLYEGEDILGSFKDGERIALSKVLMLMITTSDNTASLWCQQLAGTGAAINAWLAENGFAHTRVNSRTPGREEARTRYGWGQTTPREMAGLLLRIREGKVISARASERIYRNLVRIYFDGESLSQIPPYIQAASKSGAVNRSRSEVVMVNAPHGDYVFCVITKNQKDEGWGSDNEGYVLLRKVSKLLWNYFEPDSRWKPADKIEEWY